MIPAYTIYAVQKMDKIAFGENTFSKVLTLINAGQ